jgi:hypothetical protein
LEKTSFHVRWPHAACPAAPVGLRLRLWRDDASTRSITAWALSATRSSRGAASRSRGGQPGASTHVLLHCCGLTMKVWRDLLAAQGRGSPCWSSATTWWPTTRLATARATKASGASISTNSLAWVLGLQRFSCRLITSGAADFVRGQGEAEGWPLWPDRAFDAGIGRKTKPGGDPTDVRSAVWRRSASTARPLSATAGVGARRRRWPSMPPSEHTLDTRTDLHAEGNAISHLPEIKDAAAVADVVLPFLAEHLGRPTGAPALGQP